MAGLVDGGAAMRGNEGGTRRQNAAATATRRTSVSTGMRTPFRQGKWIEGGNLRLPPQAEKPATNRRSGYLILKHTTVPGGIAGESQPSVHFESSCGVAQYETWTVPVPGEKPSDDSSSAKAQMVHGCDGRNRNRSRAGAGPLCSRSEEHTSEL